MPTRSRTLSPLSATLPRPPARRERSGQRIARPLLRALAGALAGGVALASTACLGPGDDDALPGSKRADKAGSGSVSLTGAGATFPYPLYTKWIAEHAKATPRVKINYQSIGSGGGIRQITERTVDFGASDAPMSDEQVQKAAGILHVPTCLGSVVVAYNLEGAPAGLRLTPEVVAGVYLGKITRWSDPAIARENPGANLPDKAITTVHRSDGSGTTKVFVDYLAVVSPEWKASVGTGTSVRWPNKSAIGAKGNEGVSSNILGTPGALGYIEYAYAVQNKLPFASLRNRAGKFVLPTLEATSAAASAALARTPDDLRTSIVDAEGEGAYPIASYTYLLVYKEQKSASKGRALVDFLLYALGPGQEKTRELHYAPLPADVTTRALAKVASIVGPDGKPLVRPGELPKSVPLPGRVVKP